MDLFNFTSTTDLTDYTLIIPSVSVGNVPQLTVDFIISTYELQKVATIWHPGIIPSVGGDPYHNTSNEIFTACELYTSEPHKLAVIQLRSSIERKYMDKFFEALKQSLMSFKLKDMIILTSSFAHEMHDVNSSKYRYLTTHIDDSVFEKADVLKLQVENDEYVIHGAGFAGKLYEVLKSDFAVSLLMKYTSEGDNRPDAMQMLDMLHRIINNFKKERLEEFRLPISWKFVFGNPPPIGIY